MTGEIKNFDISPVSYRKFMDFRRKLLDKGKISSYNGVYRIGSPKYMVKSTTSKLEDHEILVSPFVNEIKLYIQNEEPSFGIIRLKSYITSRLEIDLQIIILRIEKSEPEDNRKKSFKYTAIALKAGKLSEIYICNSLTTNFSGGGGAFHRDIEKFILDNRLEAFSISGDMNLSKIKNTVQKYLVLNGYM